MVWDFTLKPFPSISNSCPEKSITCQKKKTSYLGMKVLFVVNDRWPVTTFDTNCFHKVLIYFFRQTK